jgi:hypothetical protein
MAKKLPIAMAMRLRNEGVLAVMESVSKQVHACRVILWRPCSCAARTENGAGPGGSDTAGPGGTRLDAPQTMRAGLCNRRRYYPKARSAFPLWLCRAGCRAGRALPGHTPQA